MRSSTKAIILLILTIIAGSLFARRGGAFTPQPEIYPIPATLAQPRLTTPDTFVQERVAAIAKAAQDAGPCNLQLNPSGCHIIVKSLLDFVIYLQFCPKLANWTIAYPLTPQSNVALELTPTALGACQIVLNYGIPNVQSAVCHITQDEINAMSSAENLAVVYQYEKGAVSAQTLSAILQPVFKCLSQPPNIQLPGQPASPSRPIVNPS